MSEESSMAKPVEMITAKYLDPMYLANETVANPAVEDPQPQGKSTLEWITRGIGVCVIGAMIVIVPMTASSAYTELKATQAKETHTCRSFGDWVLWCAGSKRTFSDHIKDKYDECQRAITQPRSLKELGFEPAPVSDFKIDTQWYNANKKVPN